MKKQAYLSPTTGDLEVSIIRDHHPRVLIQLDLGIPNFTVFTLTIPLAESEPQAMAGLVDDAIEALLEEVTAFMISLEFEKQVMVAMYAIVLDAWRKMGKETDTDEMMPKSGFDPGIKSYRSTFVLPQLFINETQRRVVTGATQVVKRLPETRNLELKTLKRLELHEKDVAKTIRQYRNRTLKTQPKPMYVVVYDQMGRPTGTLPLGGNFKNKLLKQIYSAAAPDFTGPVDFKNDVEMKIQNVQGIPKMVTLATAQYYPEAYCGTDMALYCNQTYSKFFGGKQWLVKFPDGRLVKFADRPSIQTLKKKNYPVPDSYWRWNLIKEEPMPEREAPEPDQKTFEEQEPDESSAFSQRLKDSSLVPQGFPQRREGSPYSFFPRSSFSEPMEEAIRKQMERRSFGESSKGNSWVEYSRNTQYPGDGVWLRVHYSRDRVSKVEGWTGAHDGAPEVREGWDGLTSFTNTYGD